MRLLHHDHDGELVLTSFDNYEQPAYTILSHTWGKDEEEVSFADFVNGGGKDKLGYDKIRLCGEQTRRDGLQYFWVDTCCIDKSNKAELSSAIRSMFRWYQDAAKCYAYLSDVSTKKRKFDDMLEGTIWEQTLISSRWFMRGWTLQELLAPRIVELFSQEWERLGDKTSLKLPISRITGIPQEVLQGNTLAQFDVSERLRWRGDRKTKLKEDMAYSLSGICDVDIAPLYGEGEEQAFKRLHKEIQKLKDCLRDLRHGDPQDDKKRIEETKGGLLVDSYRWVLDNATFQQWEGNPRTQLLWVKGDPGKGKTMLLCGIIDELRSSMPKTTLLSYFFCQATFSHLNSATAVLRGLLYMLIVQQPSLALHIYKRYDLAGKRLFEDANAWIALTEIWVDVLRDPGLRMSYLLIDALDECTTDRSHLLRFIAMQSSSSSRVKWIVSSRNLSEIERSLEPAGNKAPLSLELNASSISAAVNTFIETKVFQLAGVERYDEDIRDFMLEYLIVNANDTFLWVALVCQHLQGTPKRHVMEKLKSIPFGLEPFYKRMMGDISESEDAEICRSVLATTAILFRPVLILELTSIVGTLMEFTDDPETVREIVGSCGSFLTVKEDTVYFVHQSAQDFLLADAKDEIFPNGICIVHQEIFRTSLAVLSSQLHKDMYRLKAPGVSIDIAQPPDPDPLASLRYSCIYWVDHLCDSKSTFQADHTGSNLIADEVMLFVKNKYLYWIEGLSLCKSTAKCVVAMEALSSLAEDTSNAQDLIELVKDAHRFALHSKDIIERYPLQAYASALLFSPSGSLIRKAFQHEEPNWVTILPDMSETWSPCLHEFDERCTAVAFSHNSNQLALALSGGIIKIWDAGSSSYLHDLEGYKTNLRRVDQLRFFQDSALLVAISGIYDEMIKIWDIATGTCLSNWKFDRETSGRKVPFGNDVALQALAQATIGDSITIFDTVEAKLLSSFTSPHYDTEDHLSSTFSHSGSLLAVIFGTNIKIWDAASNRHIQSIDLPVSNTTSEPTYVASACFSESELLVVGLTSGTVIVSSINSGSILHVLDSGAHVSNYGDGRMVAVSHDSRKVASSSGNSSLKIWDLSNTSIPQTFDGKTTRIISAAFSHDSKRLVSQSVSGDINIWDTYGRDRIHTPHDHRGIVSALAFSDDSTWLASGSHDCTVKIWDLHGGCLQTLDCHPLGILRNSSSSEVVKLDVFYHPERVGTLSRAHTYRIWDVASGQCLRIYEFGNSETVYALSHDSRLLAHTGGTRTAGGWPVQVWDVDDDVCFLTLVDDSVAAIYSIAFSGDSTRLAVLGNNDIVKIFHLESGECVQTLDWRFDTSRTLEKRFKTSRSSNVSPKFSYRFLAFSNDAMRLAFVWKGGTIRVWDRNNDGWLHTSKTGNLLRKASFDQSGQFLLTDFGRIEIPGSSDLDGCVAALGSQSPIFRGVGMSLGKHWITYNSVNVLWLPPEYRPNFNCLAISGNSVGVAADRKVWIFTLFPEYLE